MEKGVANQQVFEEKEIQQMPRKIPSNHSNAIRFMVQLAVSKKPIEIKQSNFKGLKNVFIQKEGDFYRYFFGESKSYKQIQKEKRKAIRAGFKSAFIVSYKGSEKIKLSEALNELK